MNIITEFPEGFQSKYFTSVESTDMPKIYRVDNVVYYPAFVRKTTRTYDESSEPITVYSYFNVPVKFVGQRLDNESDFIHSSYQALRKYFYSTPEAQNEMRDDLQWEAHRLAVRRSFPKFDGEVQDRDVRFNEIKTTFWLNVDKACASISKTRADLPPIFDAEDMVQWAVANGMPKEEIDYYASIFSVVSLNLLQNNRNWDELFN